ncbi:uncharacterized protein LOC117186108 [Drosophila miranda]|uniref:uncharacterized protein LOC117186108 n=1 Tax=Drosophila miranda TaxID=7229 RepID=UPI00143F5818|nr:uncharacterized protein LOC117186108 [Drosophila miranda]
MSNNKRKFVHRKSIRAQRQLIKQKSKLNGLNVNVAKTRPRILTPEVAKDGSTNPGHPATAALAQAINMKDGFAAVSTLSAATNITTLSFPFTMANSSGGGDTIPTGTLSILPIAANAQLPTITTTASGYEPNDVITTIPVSLSIQRSPSSLSIVDLAQEQDGYSNSGSSNGMTVGPGAGGGGGITTTSLLFVKPLNGSGKRQRQRQRQHFAEQHLQSEPQPAGSHSALLGAFGRSPHSGYSGQLFIRWHDRPAPERRHGNGNGNKCSLNSRQTQSRGQDRRGLCLSGGSGHLFRPIHWIIAFVVGLSTPFQNH